MVRVPSEISVVTWFLIPSHGIYEYTCALNPHAHNLSKGRTGKKTGSKKCLSCSCTFHAAMQGDYGKPVVCNDACSLGKVGRRDGSQMEKTVRPEEEEVSHVHILGPKVCLTDKKLGEQMFPLTS